jgi:site-specific recombinase XerD
MNLAANLVDQTVLLAPTTWVAKIDLLAASNPFSDHCQINSRNDLEAARLWLDQYKEQSSTLRAYTKEVDRFLLWCIYEKGSTIGNLRVEDFNEYFDFLTDPPKSWCTFKAALRHGRGKGDWRPLLGALTRNSLLFAVKTISSLMNYLAVAGYVRSNPIRLIKKYRVQATKKQDLAKYQAWQRMLEQDEWLAVEKALDSLPEDDEDKIDHKMRTQFLFALLYLLGLRIHEVVNHGWNAFRKLNGRWWFFVYGKGDKLGHVPVNEQLLSMVKIYRIYLNKKPLPEAHENERLLISKKTKRPLGIRRLSTMVKAIGILAAQEFNDNLTKKKKLMNLSPHWLRHLSASHQDRAGISGTVIQANHRHSSFNTTQIYLHAEDNFRSNEMEKIKMDLQMRPITLAKAEIEPMVINLELIGGAFSEAEGLQRFMTAIENNILEKFGWSKHATNEQLIAKYKKTMILKTPLKISYLLNTKLEQYELEQLKRAIMREAEIRLFNCMISCSKQALP